MGCLNMDDAWISIAKPQWARTAGWQKPMQWLQPGYSQFAAMALLFIWSFFKLHPVSCCTRHYGSYPLVAFYFCWCLCYRIKSIILDGASSGPQSNILDLLRDVYYRHYCVFGHFRLYVCTTGGILISTGDSGHLHWHYVWMILIYYHGFDVFQYGMPSSSAYY